ncbi:hypothetical protein MINS_27330 [Mycolicibacterium insubricum]|uniref:AAA family ATPase n=1 Tax=Mycolicibacterium insubricum TaxID=444597 RepID=UPI00138B4264|nr:AAA family ATPase [Mycolicibacterium insubricum]MCV7080885.1 AAA family ATPase [Mycolicibacterium insubricum]BBZ67304.1 hypothetical protein MINS_27330 [Mycolicibacterium insubricum]
MYIERLQVESEGFLAGLDLRFDTGLNVIIGARGTGKTSIIELIRYCTNAEAFTEDAAARGSQQAIAILDGGAVTLTVRDQDSRFEITRSAAGHFSRTQSTKISCTVLAQNEVEAIGAQASGRLRLLDRFRKTNEMDQRKLDSLQSQLRSQTVEIAAIIAEGSSIADEIESLGAVEAELALAQEAQQAVLGASDATDVQQTDLKRLQETSRLIANREQILLAEESRVTDFRQALEELSGMTRTLLRDWPSDAGNDPISQRRSFVSDVSRALNSAAEAVARLAEGIDDANRATLSLKSSVDVQSRELRQRLEAVQKGIGQASRLVASLEEKRGRLQALRNVLEERRTHYLDLVEQRDAVYRSLDRRRSEIYEQRTSIASDLSHALAPTIQIRLTRSENVDDYRSAIAAALRGSGIHYNTLAPQLAREVSPLELAHWVESSDVEALASTLSIRRDRAQSVIENLSGPGLGRIISATIEDGVSLYLLDGPEYKSSDQLSIGQRCTVVLPILLGTHGDPLVVDQPEDHLDNAFIASTLVNSLRRRNPVDQIIFSSHNANIPVLGEADQVIVMESDGRHGYAVHQGTLDEAETVRHITRVMEGGIEAFEARSAFYGTAGAASWPNDR